MAAFRTKLCSGRKNKNLSQKEPYLYGSFFVIKLTFSKNLFVTLWSTAL
jgi:hypothetical protein